MWREYTVVGAGGALGAILRFVIAGYVARRYGDAFPLGTLLVNASGCLLIGLIASSTDAEGYWPLGPLWRQFMMIGILGGYTTFSSFSLQTLDLARAGAWFSSSLYVVLSVVLCLLAVWIGLECGAAINRWR